jgi:uncharacterized protein YktB (UPF0637 family)
MHTASLFTILASYCQEVDFVEKSMEEIVARIKRFKKVKKTDFIVGNGWDQNDCVKEFPSKEDLDNIFQTHRVEQNRWPCHYCK